MLGEMKQNMALVVCDLCDGRLTFALVANLFNCYNAEKGLIPSI